MNNPTSLTLFIEELTKILENPEIKISKDGFINSQEEYYKEKQSSPKMDYYPTALDNQEDKEQSYSFIEALDELLETKDFKDCYLRRDSWPKDKRVHFVSGQTIDKYFYTHTGAVNWLTQNNQKARIKDHLDLSEGEYITVGWTPSLEDLQAQDWDIYC